MANGLISSNEMLDVEDVGDELWNELYWRSFFQDIQIDNFGKITCFKMHDLVHDLAQSVAEEVYCSEVNSDTNDVSERILHLSIYGSSIQLQRFKSLKTCIIGKHCYYSMQLLPQILKCRSLRVLECRGLESLSTSIGHLIYIRYLDISYGSFRNLPESLCRLWNLQILKLDYCRSLQELPNNLVRLKSLQHLSLRHCTSLWSLPPHMGKLTCLRTLSMYFVGNEKGFHLAELGRLNLKGELHIKHLERVKGVIDAKEANMSSKHLNHLQLSWGRNEESQLQENVEQIFEVLQPHTQQLQTLLVEGYRGACFPQWMSSPSLKYLIYLIILDCKDCLHLPQLGKLPSLKYLSISNMSQVTYLYEESCDDVGVAGIFIALKSLKLKEMPNLIRLSREDGENMFPHLSRLQIIGCPNLLGLPCLPSLNDLKIQGKCNQDLLSSIHKFHSLEHLYLGWNEELTCFPNGMLNNLTSLKILNIFRYSKLEELVLNEISGLEALQHLDIYHCDSLKSLTDEALRGLQSLKKLVIAGCPEFNLSPGFQYLTCLGSLEIRGISEMRGLHEALQHMATLESLTLSDLPNLDSLPASLGNLASLRSLIISECPKLMCLPSSTQCLNRLEQLSIISCEELGKRCEKEAGEDWPKIAHVHRIEIQT